jgi:hypothetical protein
MNVCASGCHARFVFNLYPSVAPTHAAVVVGLAFRVAKSENRSLSNFIEKVLKEEIVRHESKQARGKSG